MHKISVALIAAIYSLFGGIAHAITIDSLDSSSTNAAPAGDVIISPLRWVETVSPGDRITRAFQIGNRTSNPMIFELSTEDMVGTRDLEDPVRFLGAQRAPTQTTARDWLIPEVREFRVDPGKRAVVSVVLQVPRDAKPGGHYAALFASGQAITDKGTGSISDPASGVDIRTRLGVLLLANVRASDNDTGFTDTIQPSGRIVSFSSSRRVYSDTTIPLSIVVENTGQTHLTANTTVTITNLSGKIVGRMQSSDWHVLPDSVREKRFTWSRSVLFGKYYAVAEVAFAGKIITASTTFWVIPMNIVVAVIIAIALFWFMWWLRQWRAKYPT